MRSHGKPAAVLRADFSAFYGDFFRRQHPTDLLAFYGGDPAEADLLFLITETTSPQTASALILRSKDSIYKNQQKQSANLLAFYGGDPAEADLLFLITEATFPQAASALILLFFSTPFIKPQMGCHGRLSPSSF